LELTWIGKENRPKLEPRILLEYLEKSYHAPHRVTGHDFFDNRLIFGDNLARMLILAPHRKHSGVSSAPLGVCEFSGISRARQPRTRE